MKSFYVQVKYFEGWGVNERTSRSIFYTTGPNNIGQLGRSRWLTDCGPYDVMCKLQIKRVL